MKPFPFAVLLATVLMVMTAVVVAAAPALADVTGGDPPDYVLDEDGTVLIDGDLATDCRSFAGGPVPSADDDPDLEQAQRVLEQCRQGGFLPSGGSAPPSSPDPATADATASADSDDDEESATASASAEAEALPDTGGVSPALLTVLPALLLVGAGVMAVRVVRRN